MSAKREEPVQARPVELDVGRRLDITRHQPEHVPLVDQARPQLHDAGQDAVPVRVLDSLVHVMQTALEQTCGCRSGGRCITASNVRRPTSGSVMPASVNLPMSAGIP